MATDVASRAARIFAPGIDIEPDASTMTISAAGAVAGRLPPPVAVTVTIALTSSPPAGRNSFWKVSALNRVMSQPSFAGDVDDGDGHVVAAAGRKCVVDERLRGGQRRAAGTEVAQLARRADVPRQPIGAEHDATARRDVER